jgi:hypothetical protein
VSSCLTEFEIVIAFPRAREGWPAPQAPVALSSRCLTSIDLKLANEGFGQRAKSPVMITSLT